MENKAKTLYHGSQYKITDGIIHARDAYLPTTNTPMTAVFATADFARARNYACMRLIADGWKSPKTSDTLYVQKLSQDISGKKAYIYELDSDGFERDTDGTYYSLNDKPIKRVIEIDVMQEITNGNIKVHVLKQGIDCPKDRGDIWAELVNNKDNFEMYKPDIDVKNLYPDVYAKVAQIIKELHDPATGFFGLQHSIASKLASELSPDKLNTLKTEYKTNKNLQLCITNMVLHKINEFESAYHPGAELTNEQRNKFEKSVLDEIKVLLQNPKEYAQIHSLNELDDMRFSLSGENIIKYRFYSSCGNAADAFAYKNEQLGQNRMPLAFLHSTCWNNLIDGMRGHTIPCIQLPNGKYIALDPQVPDVKFITSELKDGNKIYHLLHGHVGVPYMITGISDKNYNNRAEFMRKAGKVPYNKAVKFLETISDDVNAVELKEYKEKISQWYREQMKQATKSTKKIAHNTENQLLQSIAYANKELV